LFNSARADETYELWAVSLSDDNSVASAYTVNDSGALLGQYCYASSGNCVWTLGMTTGCETGSEYPVLANTDTGSVQLKIKCGGRLPTGAYAYAFTDFDAIDKAVKNATRIGFAVPMQADEFRVVRFLLSGANAAINHMLQRAQAMKTGKHGTRDQIL
jgi:hypothetical protein